MKILVTGATGFVGSVVTRRLVGDGYNVHIIKRKTSNTWRIDAIKNDIEIHDCDITSDKLKGVVESISPDCVMHFANSGLYGGRHAPDKELIDVNFFGTVNLINSLSDVDYKIFVNTGSSAEYGRKETRMNEYNVCVPVSMYGVTKLASTSYGSFVAKTQDKPIITMRIFSPYGSFDDKSRLITYAILSAIKNNKLELANSNSVRDYIYVEDIADLYAECMKCSIKPGEVYNVGSGQQRNVSFIVNKIIEISGSKSKLKWNSIASRNFESEVWEANMSKTFSAFKWRPNTSLEDGLRQTIEWFKKNSIIYA